MPDQTPVERAAEALLGTSLGEIEDDARTVFESIDVDALATATGRHQPVMVHGSVVECSCSRWPYDERDDVTLRGFDVHQAEAVKAWLTGGAS